MIDIKQSYLTLLNTGRPTVTLVAFIFPSAEKLKGNPGLFLQLQTSQPSKNLGLNRIFIHLFVLKSHTRDCSRFRSKDIPWNSSYLGIRNLALGNINVTFISNFFEFQYINYGQPWSARELAKRSFSHHHLHICDSIV